MIVGGFFFYINSYKNNEKEITKVTEIPGEILPIKNFVESCLEEVVPPGIYLLASKGGYIYSFDQVLNAEKRQIAYHLVYNSNTSPSKTYMEYELSRYIRESLPLCLKNFTIFNYYTFEYGNIEATSEISTDKVSVQVHYPITIISNNSKTVLSDFTAEYPIRLGHILDIKDKILSNIKKTGMVGFNVLSSFDVELNVIPYDTETLIYSIYDGNSSMRDGQFYFNFAVKVYGDTPPRLEFVPDFVLTKGKLFEYQLEAEDDDENDTIRFYSDNALINLNETSGQFSFTPMVSGDYEIDVCVQDKYLENDCKTMKFMIQDE